MLREIFIFTIVPILLMCSSSYFVIAVHVGR